MPGKSRNQTRSGKLVSAWHFSSGEGELDAVGAVWHTLSWASMNVEFGLHAYILAACYKPPGHSLTS